MTTDEAAPVHAGRCDCGGVQYDVKGPLRDVWNCHCPRCRRLTGHHLAATPCDRDQLTLRATETLRWYEPAPGVFYGFCGQCGSTLFWRVDAAPERISITAGTLDQPTGLSTTVAWWVAEAGDYHERPPLTEYAHES